MAHNLNINDGKVSFASNKKAWHNLGQIVEGAMTAEQALNLAGLDFEVKKTPIIINNENINIKMNNKFITYRTDTNEALGVVGKRYEILQNKDAFSFFDSIIDNTEAVYETAGALGKGEKIFITAKMPEYIRINGTDDLTEIYVLLTSSHDGSGTVTAAITPVRVVCQNTLNMALKTTQNKVNIRHTTNLKHNLSQAHKILGITNSLTKELNESLNFLSKKRMTDTAVSDLINELFKTEKKDSSIPTNIKRSVFESYLTGRGQEKIIGTAWGVLNGITYYLDHNKNYKNDDVKFKSLFEGEGVKIVNKAYNLLLKY